MSLVSWCPESWAAPAGALSCSTCLQKAARPSWQQLLQQCRILPVPSLLIRVTLASCLVCCARFALQTWPAGPSYGEAAKPHEMFVQAVRIERPRASREGATRDSMAAIQMQCHLGGQTRVVPRSVASTQRQSQQVNPAQILPGRLALVS